MSGEKHYQRTRIIVPADIDGQGHVNNIIWVRFVVELSEAHMAALGYDEARHRALGVTWIVQRHEVTYHRPAFSGDAILEETWVASLRGARSTRHCRFRPAAGGDDLVTAATQWVLIDAATGRPRRIDRIYDTDLGPR